MYTLIVRASFQAAHCIPGHKGKCAHLHGHGYRVEAEFSGSELDQLGMLQDFADLRDAVERILPDHTYLNEVLDGPTTAENIARWLFDRLQAMRLPVAAVTVWETDQYGCRYEPDPRTAGSAIP
ncbi:MAG: 6-pyruvoyl trahydropterin synthase family protein [Chthonomonadales bacterium]